jgi:hypothetical protein
LEGGLTIMVCEGVRYAPDLALTFSYAKGFVTHG